MAKDNIKDINELRREKEERDKKAKMGENENKNVTEETVNPSEETVEEVIEETVEPVTEEPVETEEDKYQKLNDSYMRLMADFDNYRKRAAKDREAMIIYSTSKFAEGLFPIVDNFTRALESEENKDNGFYQGVEMIYNQLTGLLKDEGIEKIECLGEKFDPVKEQAVFTGCEEDKDDDIVLEVFQDGYIYKEKVLRPAMVKVNKLK